MFKQFRNLFSLSDSTAKTAWYAMLVLVVAAIPATGFAQQKHAIFVAVNDYQRSDELKPLKYAEADALALKSEFEANGYEVTMLLGDRASRTEISLALEEINGKQHSSDYLLLGFFGHGIQYDADAYFCPFDTSVRQVIDADGQKLFKGNKPLLEPDPQSMVPMKEILAAMALSNAKHKLLIADCCRKDPNLSRGGIGSRAFGTSLKLQELPRNAAAMFACSEGEKAYESDEHQHGLFTMAFLDALRQSAVPTVNEMSVAVCRRVETLVQPTGKKQTVNVLLTGGVVELGIVNPKEMVVQKVQPLMSIPQQSKQLTLTGHFEQGQQKLFATITLNITGEKVEGSADIPGNVKFGIKGTLQGSNLLATTFRDGMPWSEWECKLDLNKCQLIGNFTPFSRNDALQVRGTMRFSCKPPK